MLAGTLSCVCVLTRSLCVRQLDIRLVDLSGEAPIHVKHTTADVFEGKKVVMVSQQPCAHASAPPEHTLF